MTINEELARLGEPPTTPEEETAAQSAGEQRTSVWLNDLAETAVERANVDEMKELRRLFPQYEPIRRLGRGGMGVVYLVRHIGLDLLVALKVLPFEVGDDLQFLERFQREARALARLDHPRIVRVLNFHRSFVENVYCLEMEYLAGGTLRDRLRKNPLSPDEALRLAAAICDALHHAHTRSVVHRDISPENILFDGDNNLKVADLGLARVCGEAAFTRSTQGMGKDDYMAPEQKKNAATADHRADIYSVGVVLYEMLTGKRPLGRFEPASKLAGVSAEVDEIIDRALQHDPDRRFKSAAELKATLEAIPEDPPIPGDPPKQGWRPWLKRHSLALVAALLVLVGAAALGWWARTPAPDGILLWGGDTVGGAPYVWYEGSKLRGFEAELMEQVAHRLGMRSQFVQCDWAMLPQALQRGDIQVIFNGCEYSPQRARAMSMTIPYGLLRMRLIVRKGPGPIRAWDNLLHPPAGQTWGVGTLAASPSEKLLQRDYPNTVKIEAPPVGGTVGVLLALQNGRLDACVQDEFTASHYLARDFPGLEMVGEPRDPMYVVAYTARDNPGLRDRINGALLALMQDGTLKRIYQSYGLWTDEAESLSDVARTWPPREVEEVPSLWPNAWTLVKAAGVTVLLACVSMPLAMLLGLGIAVGRLYGPRWLGGLLAGYVELIRGTPLLLQLFALYYLLPEVGIFLPVFWAGVIGLALNYSASESEHYRAGILAVPRGQLEAALLLGMSHWTALRRIILPQAVRTVIPSVTNDFIALFKDTAVCSVIAVVELTGSYSRLVIDQPQRILTYALLTALLYLLMSYPLAVLARRLERRPHPATA
jgi:polar amino acid transport system substrate-binding protein